MRLKEIFRILYFTMIDSDDSSSEFHVPDEIMIGLSIFEIRSHLYLLILRVWYPILTLSELQLRSLLIVPIANSLIFKDSIIPFSRVPVSPLSVFHEDSNPLLRVGIEKDNVFRSFFFWLSLSFRLQKTVTVSEKKNLLLISWRSFTFKIWSLW